MSDSSHEQGSRPQGGGGPGAHQQRRADKQASSCTECRRRKQKCSQGQPCTNCARRFPQPVCDYETRTKSRRKGPRVHDPNASQVTSREGPYSHLNYAGVNEAILQVEAQPAGRTYPLIGGQPSADGLIREEAELVPIYYPSSPDPASTVPHYLTDADEFTGHFRNWLPFRLAVRGQRGATKKQSLMGALKALMEHHDEDSQSLTVEDEWMLDAARLVWAVEGAPQPSVSLGRMDDEMRHLPMPLTRLNKELVRTHLRLLSRFKASVSGSPSPDNPFMKHWIPFIIQDPLLIHTVLFTSACFLNETGHLPKTVVVALRGLVYQLLNQHLRAHQTQTTDAAILAVAEMILDEWYWGATHELHAHMKGLRIMIRLRGGLQDLGMHGYLSKLILMHDIAMGLSHETVPEIYGFPGFEFHDPIQVPFQNSLNSPLTSGWPSFVSCAGSLHLHPGTATILDDVRAMFDAIQSLPDNPSPEELSQVAAIAQWVYTRLGELPDNVLMRPSLQSRSSPKEVSSGATSPSNTNGGDSPRGQQGSSPESNSSPSSKSKSQQHSSPAKTEIIDRGTPPSEFPDPVYRMVRMTAIIYCRAILSRVPISMVCSDNEFIQIWLLTWRVPMASRRAIIGIFAWVILLLAPSCHNKAPARFVKTLAVNSLMSIAVENWHFAMEIADRSLRLQKWLKGSSTHSGMVFGGEGIIEKHGFAQKEVLGNIANVHRGNDVEEEEEEEGDEHVESYDENSMVR